MENQTLRIPGTKHQPKISKDWSAIIETLCYRERDENGLFMVGLTIETEDFIEDFYSSVSSACLLNFLFDTSYSETGETAHQFTTKRAAQDFIINQIFQGYGIELTD